VEEESTGPGAPGANGDPIPAEPVRLLDLAAADVPRERRRWVPRQVKWTFTAVVLFFVLEYVLLPEITSARKSISLLGRVNVLWLILACGLEVGAWVAYSGLTYAVLSPTVPSRFRILRINMSSLAVSHILPGGTAPGTAVAYRLLSESGVPGSVAGTGLATQGIGSAVVLNMLFWLALLISIPLTGYNPLYGFAAIFGVLLISASAGVVLLFTKGRSQASGWLHRLSKRVPFVNPNSVAALVQRVADRLEILFADRHLLLRALAWSAAFWLLDASSLWVFILAFGHVVQPLDLLVAYGLANILAVIPITPSGLGVVEGVLIPTLSGFGVAKEVAILGVLSWRLINFWLPIPAGGLSYLSLRVGPMAKTGKVRREWPPVPDAAVN
jgi:uncharacterized protein (TIRG00374 family)